MTTFGTTHRTLTGPLGTVQLDRGCAGLLVLLLGSLLAGATRGQCIEAIGYCDPDATYGARACLCVRLCHVRRALRAVGSAWRIQRIVGAGMVLHLNVVPGRAI